MSVSKSGYIISPSRCQKTDTEIEGNFKYAQGIILADSSESQERLIYREWRISGYKFIEKEERDCFMSAVVVNSGGESI